MDWEILKLSLAVMNGLVFCLSLFLIISKKVFQNYGTSRVEINGIKEIKTDGGISLLVALFNNKVFLPSACGGKGTCGYCRIKVKKGGGDVLPTEEMVLSRQEIRDNVRLACQIKVRGDISVDIPTEYLAVNEFKIRLEKSENVSSSIKKMIFKLIEPPKISFKAGQYIQTVLTLDGEVVQRAYSIASPPELDSIIELNIRRIEGGITSNYLHSLTEGAEITIVGPFGDFYLREDRDRSIVCIAGGCGLAPIKSIILHVLGKGNFRNIYLFYGARDLSNLYDHEIFSGFAAKYPNFTYVPALSHILADDPWCGERGFIHEVFRRLYHAKEAADAYVCGPPPMIEAVMPVLLEKGFDSKDIYYDKF